MTLWIALYGKNNKRSVIGQVVRLNVPESEIEPFKDRVKEITTKYNKKAFFEKGEYQVEEEIESGTKSKRSASDCTDNI